MAQLVLLVTRLRIDTVKTSQNMCVYIPYDNEEILPSF